MGDNRIGVMIYDNLGLGLLHDTYARILNPFKVYCEKAGYMISFFNDSPEYLKECSFVEQAGDMGFCGLFLVYAKYGTDEVEELFDIGLPIVTIGEPHPNAIAVSSDNGSGIRDLVKYICGECNHRKVAFICGDADSIVNKIRLKAFKESCKEIGIKIPAEYIRQSRFKDIRDVSRRTEELLNYPDPPTCIIFPDDFAAIGGINVIHNRGLEVPHDISYCGYDGISVVSHLDPQLTTVVHDTDSMGVTAAQKLIDMIREHSVGDGSEITIPTILREGHTVRKMYQ